MMTHRGMYTFLISVTLSTTFYAAFITATNNLEALNGVEKKAVNLDGDIILGGLFPMHEKGHDGQICGSLKEDKGIQRLEAMLYALKTINEDDKLLPSIKLGARILDTCLRDTFALEQSLDFIKAKINTLDLEQYHCSNGEPASAKNHTKSPVAGVIGAAASPVSIMVANILRLFKIPQISYASTGIELSDKTRFGYFSRVVPPDTYQAQALVDVVGAFNWSYVSTVADEGNYGEKGISAFEKEAEKRGICIAASVRIPREPDTSTFHKIIDQLLKFRRARVVVMFVNEDNIKRLLSASTRINVNGTHFYWLASDSWGAKTYPVEGQQAAAEGAVTILPTRQVVEEFDEYIKELTPENHKINPWFEEFWVTHFKCSLGDNLTNNINRCDTGRRRIGADSGYKQEGLVPFVIDAVYLMAHALHELHKVKCGSRYRGVCDAMTPLSGADLLGFIRNVSFTGSAGTKVSLNENGDAMGRYTIYQYQQNRAWGSEYVKIGKWEGSLELNMELAKWRHDSDEIPRSVCSEPCPPGYVRNSKGLRSCCWACIKCMDYEILQDDFTCIPCKLGSYPSANKTVCENLEIEYITLNSAWAIVPIVFSSLGILATLFVVVVFFRFNATPVIMASGRELCYVLLFGFFMCYSMTFIMVAKPSIGSCSILRLGLGLSLSICYAALFTKTNRISRIFNRGIKAMVKRPSYTSPRSQLIICFSLVSVQIMAAVTWLAMEPPGIRMDYPDRRSAILRCHTTNFSIVLSLLYNMVLIILCTVYAFKTRNIPENYNEAKYIAFTMYSTCILWLAFIPIFFGTKNDYKIQTTALCMGLSISATVAMGCLFFPKVYLVLFQPHKNVRTSVASALNPSSGTSRRTLFGQSSSSQPFGGAMNGVTSPTGLALLIAHGNKKEEDEATGKSASSANEMDSLKDLESSDQGSSGDEHPETHL